MLRRLGGVVLFAGLVGLIVSTAPVQARGRASLRIGVIHTLAPGVPPGILAVAMKPFRTYLEEHTGSSGEIVRSGDSLGLAKQLSEGSVQLGIFHGHEFAWARSRYPDLQPVVICVNPAGSVRALLVTSVRVRAASHADLAGKSIALPRDMREPCRLYFERRCVPPGRASATFYRRISRPADGEEALEEVVRGKVEAALVDAVAWERYHQLQPARAGQLRLLQASEAFPAGVLACYRGRLPESTVQRVRAALLDAGNHARGRQSLQMLKLARFALPPDNHDEELARIAKAYPPAP